MIDKIIGLRKENGQLIFILFGIKMRFKSPCINQLEEVCCIQNLAKIQQQNTNFPHPIGIVIHPKVNIGLNCTIYQNVTIGAGKFINGNNIPSIGNNVVLYANSVIIGGIKIGDNSVIGAGSVVISDVPANTVVVGNPARVVKYLDN